MTQLCSQRAELYNLIAQRLQPNADKESIDLSIWEQFGGQYAVMFTDLVGFSRRVAQFGIIHFLQTIYEAEHLLTPLIKQHGGVLLKIEGDSLFIRFASPIAALQAAIAMQHLLRRHNQQRIEEEQVLLCIGLGYGRMLKIADEDIYGPEVNAASNLGENIAQSGEILATAQFVETCKGIIRTELLPQITPPGARAAYRIIYE